MTLRGRAGRARALSNVISVREEECDRRAAVLADIRAAMKWVEHLRDHGINTRDDMVRHLRDDARIVAFNPPDLFDAALAVIGRASLGGRTRRPSQALGMRILAALKGYACEETVKKQLLQRVVRVRLVNHNINALLELMRTTDGSSPPELPPT